MQGQPIQIIPMQEMRKSALERGLAAPLGVEVGLEKEVTAGQKMPSSTTRWVPQPVSFPQLKGYHNPYHSRCVRIKARMSAGLGFQEEPEGGKLVLPPSAKGDTIQQQIILAAMDCEVTGNGYLEVILDGGRRVATVTWLQAETMEVSEDGAWYRHVVRVPGSGIQRTTYYPAWPRDGVVEAATRYCLHIAQDGTWSTHYGEPDWLGCLQSVMLFDSAMRYNRALFDNNCIPTWLILLLGVKLDDEKPEDPNNAGHFLPSQREKFVEWMQATYGGASNAGKAMLLDLPTESDKASASFQKLQDGPKDGEFLKMLDTMRDQILSCHGVPPRLAGVVTSGSLGGSGELFGQLLAFREDLQPKRIMYEQALASLIPFLPPGAPKTLTLREMDIEPFRNLGAAPPPVLPADSSAAKVAAEVDLLLKQAGVR